MADYEGDSKDDIDNVNVKVNHLENSDKNSTQYVIVTHLFNKSFMHFFTTQDIVPLNEASIAQYFILDQYPEMVFQDIMPDTGASKVLTAGKS